MPDQPTADITRKPQWQCGKCESTKARGYDDGQIPNHFRTCPKRFPAPDPAERIAP